MHDSVQITDVTLRDGLQMEGQVIAASKKLKLFEKLSLCGFSRIEVTSFVHPKWVPQFSDALEFCELLYQNEPPLPLMAFVPNAKGLDRLLKFPIDWACAFVATSESFNQKNVNASVSESIQGLSEIVEKTKTNQRKLRIYVSTVFGCPYEGAISDQQTFDVLKKVADLNPDEIALSDTIGVATPEQVKRILTQMFSLFDKEKVALHLHNTYGNALAVAEIAYQMGVRHFDGATGGLGGCPYAKGASGNVASEGLSYLFNRQGRLNFEKKAFYAALDYLNDDLKLKVHSPLAEIYFKGGDWYGV